MAEYVDAHRFDISIDSFNPTPTSTSTLSSATSRAQK
ncbi:hypothetical protein AB1N83_012007 [Pleurotus pulmonarius]